MMICIREKNSNEDYSETILSFSKIVKLSLNLFGTFFFFYLSSRLKKMVCVEIITVICYYFINLLRKF